MQESSRKEQILNAALTEFSRCSYDDASLNTILRDSGVSKGSFYYHFTDKKELYLQLLRSAAEAKWEFIRSQSEEVPSESGDIFSIFRAQARLGAIFAKQHPEYHQLARRLLDERGKPIYDDIVKQLGGDASPMLGTMVDQGIAAGTLTSTLPRDFLIHLLTYLFTHFEEILDTESDVTIETTLENLDYLVQFLQQGAGRRQ